MTHDNNTTEEMLKYISRDIEKLDSIEKNSNLITLALFNALYKSLNECNVTANITKNKDDFFKVNLIYIATLSIYLDLLGNTKNDILKTDISKLEEKDKKIVLEQTAVFIALLGKFFRSARTIKINSEYNNLLPVKMWLDNVEDLIEEEK